ncbi:MAG: type III-B CRISPR module-associated protein Cmr5 [bacterium]
MPEQERNLEHKRAEYAFKCISEIIELKNPKYEAQYRSVALSSGVLIQKSGLMQALAFYISKKEHHKKLAEHILKWIQCPGINVELQFQCLLNISDEDMVRKTMETRDFISWLKRFAEGRLRKEEDNVIITSGNSQEKVEQNVNNTGL